jgi:ankyrin repeat protein
MVLWYFLQETGESCLHAAIKRRDIEITKILLEANCPVDIQNVSIK